jgi:hypothetical protein
VVHLQVGAAMFVSTEGSSRVGSSTLVEGNVTLGDSTVAFPHNYAINEYIDDTLPPRFNLLHTPCLIRPSESRVTDIN